MIKNVMKKITGWFNKIFDLDIGSIIKDMAGPLGKGGSWLLGKIGLGGNDKPTGKTPEEIQAETKKKEETRGLKKGEWLRSRNPC
jgi:hypothetical protein